MGSIEPGPEGIQALVDGDDDGQPVVMINLLRYRVVADYPDDFPAEPCSGREAYQRYGQGVVPCLESVGGKMIWVGSVRATVIAPEDEQWDDAILIQYPNREAFVSMVAKPEYQAIAPHRTAALEDSRLIATTTVANLLEG